jgi:cytochrome c oxidase assembly protein subunit 11
MTQPTQQQRRNRRTGWLLAGGGIAMFAFGFALVPIYGLICDVAGINRSGKANFVSEDQLQRFQPDASRTITVEFDATVESGLAWEFRPMVRSMEIHPGKIYEVMYFAQNNSDHAIVGQAIPGVTPWQATEHFNKTECFCFKQQTLQPGEGKEMPLRFVIDAALPQELTTVTLSYTFMDTGLARSLDDSNENDS